MRFQEKDFGAGLCKKCFEEVSGKGYDVVKVKKQEKVLPNLSEKQRKLKAIIDEEIQFQKQFCRKNEERWAENARIRKAKQRQLDRFFLELQTDLNRFKKKVLEEFVHKQISDDSSKKLLDDQKSLNVNDLKESI